MTLSVPIDPNTEARLRDLAKQAGKDLTAFVSELVENATSARTGNGVHSADEFDQALAELFTGDTRKLPPIPLTFSREDIYFDHD